MATEISNQIERLKEKFLLAAASGGRLLECQSLLELGADIEYVSEEYDEDTPLLAACRNGHRSIVSLLLAHGADPAACDKENNTALHIIAETGDEALAALFSPNAGDICSRTNNDGKTAIDLAVERGYSSFAEHLHHIGNNDDSSESDGTDSQYSSQSPSDTLPHLSSLTIDDDSYEDNNSGYDSDTSATISNDESKHPNDVEDSLSTAANDDISSQEGERKSVAELQIELYQAKYALSAMMKERDELKAELAKLQPLFSGDDTFYSQKTLQELQAYERQVKTVLKRIEEAKQNLDEEKLCVVCRENPKGVLLMPCRHLCLCKECGHRVELERCPLCRETIFERISVFS